MGPISFFLDFAQRWLGSLPLLILTFLAALMVVLVITALWEFRTFLTRGGLTRELRGAPGLAPCRFWPVRRRHNSSAAGSFCLGCLWLMPLLLCCVVLFVAKRCIRPTVPTPTSTLP